MNAKLVLGLAFYALATVLCLVALWLALGLVTQVLHALGSIFDAIDATGGVVR